MDNFETITLSKEELDFLRETFYVQSVEMTERLTAEIVALETNGFNKDSIKGIKRLFHTLKGDSSTIGLKDVAALIHMVEDLLGGVEAGDGLGAGIVDAMLGAVDEISKAILADRNGSPYVISGTLKDDIARLAGGPQTPHSFELTEYEEAIAAGHASDGKTLYRMRFSFARDCEMKSAGAHLLSRHLRKASDVIRMEPTAESVAVEKSDFIDVLAASRKRPEELKKLFIIPGVIADVSVDTIDLKDIKRAAEEPRPTINAEAPSQKKEAVQAIRVMSGKIDQMMDLVGELALGRSMIEQLVKRFESLHPEDELVSGFIKANSFLRRSLADLQRSVMSVRMVPIEKVFKKFPRMVRDICKTNGKEINLVLRGEDTDVDKALIDSVGEPLLHIIRNSVDHGIEPPAEREKAGKVRQGTISVTASHKESGIVITVEDDGRGIDLEGLKAKAVQKGLIRGEDAARMDDREAMGLIFLPGFSTAEAVSDISGRGIGLDIVKDVVENMRGAISVRSKVGTGTAFTLKFPMTLSIMRTIIVKINGKLYALPLGSIIEIIRTYRKNLDVVAGRQVLRRRDRVFPVVRMRGHREGRREDGKFFALILNHGDNTVALAVDGLVGEKELVVKAIDERWVKTDTVSGASILGDGSVVMILNVAAVISRTPGDDEARYGMVAN